MYLPEPCVPPPGPSNPLILEALGEKQNVGITYDRSDARTLFVHTF